ncbi:phage/plasmid primase, P4 family [Tateyamaria sp.]|uniref:phage/plasmid primase, P4 family n=1 Tax=Tateyamaria sp. TaxID=1929288 RepID=UPI0032A0B623
MDQQKYEDCIAQIALMPQSKREPAIAKLSNDTKKDGRTKGGVKKDVDALLKVGAALARAEGTYVEVSEEAFAEEFVRTQASAFKYNANRKAWMRWNGHKWEVDEKLRSKRAMQEMAHAVRKKEDTQDADRQALGRAAFSKNALEAATSHPDISIEEHELDALPDLLNTPDGVYNLKTGERAENDPTLLMSCSTTVSPEFKMKTPAFDTFLRETFAGNEETIRFVQMRLGYGITGHVIHEDFDFWYGDGGNGKGTLMNCVTNILGDYHKTAAETAFIADDKGRAEHSTELADLRGARLVTVSETAEGQKFKTSRIKQITGRDTAIKARFMRKDFFQYWPQFKLFIISNSAPTIDVVDDAMRRRLHVTHFKRKPPKVDPHLKDNLRVEYAGILAWLINGARLAMAEGFNYRPEEIRNDTQALLGEQDVFSRFWDVCIEEHPDGRLSRKDIREMFPHWADEADAAQQELKLGELTAQLDRKFGGRHGWAKRDKNGLLVLHGYRFTEPMVALKAAHDRKQIEQNRVWTTSPQGPGEDRPAKKGKMTENEQTKTK